MCSFCAITCLTWSKSNQLFTSCSNGKLCCYESNLTPIFYLNLHIGEINKLKLSCSEDKILTSGFDSKVVVTDLRNMQPLVEIKYRLPAKVHLLSSCFLLLSFRFCFQAIDWHPWKNQLVAIGGKSFNAIYNLNIMKPVACISLDADSYADCQTFNPVSGELLVSRWLVIHYLLLTIILNNVAVV